MNEETETSVTIKELNAFLKGQYMGIHIYEEYIEKVDEPTIKVKLQEIQQDHKEHAIMVGKRIQDLGGHPVDGPGFIGSMTEVISKAKGLPDTTDEILKLAAKGEDQYGIQMSEKLVRGDLDDESMELIHKILDKDRTHVDALNNLIENDI